MPSEAKEAVKVTQGDIALRKAILTFMVDALERGCSDGDMPDDRNERLDEMIARHREEAEKGAAAGPWMKVGTFEPIPDASYLVYGTLRLSIKLGRYIDADNVCAALIDDHIQENSDEK